MIYFIQAENGLIKIGYSRDIKKRLQNLRQSSPERLYLMKAVPGNRKAEQKIHWKFWKLRSHGEWFYPDRELLEFIVKYSRGSKL